MENTTFWKKITLKRTANFPNLDEFVSAIIENTEYLGLDDDYSSSGEPSLWNIYYLPDTCNDELLKCLKEKILSQNLPLEICPPEIVQKENWAANWRNYFKPVEISDNIVVVPEWLNNEGYKQTHKILITPGMAFGTGTHATTILCMQSLEKHVDSSIDNTTLLDIGCGTTILSILAIKLGVKSAVAFDLDPDVLENASENIELNSIKKSDLSLRVCTIHDIPESAYDYIVCNMLSREFTPIIPNFNSFAKEGTRLILSGLLISEEDSIISKIETFGFSVDEISHMDEWSCLVASYHEL